MKCLGCSAIFTWKIHRFLLYIFITWNFWAVSQSIASFNFNIFNSHCTKKQKIIILSVMWLPLMLKAKEWVHLNIIYLSSWWYTANHPDISCLFDLLICLYQNQYAIIEFWKINYTLSLFKRKDSFFSILQSI